MKKLILTTIKYAGYSYSPTAVVNSTGVYYNDPASKVITRQFLVAVNSSRNADQNHDVAAAVKAAASWYDKMVTGTRLISISAEPTIDAENPEPPVLYTEADLVSFGNYIASEARARERSGEVLHVDLENWKYLKSQQS